VVERERTSVAASKGLTEAFASKTDSALPSHHSQSIHSVQSSSIATSGRFVWNDAKLLELRSHFASELHSGKITMKDVSEKLEVKKALQEIGLRRVYDKLRVALHCQLTWTQVLKE